MSLHKSGGNSKQPQQPKKQQQQQKGNTWWFSESTMKNAHLEKNTKEHTQSAPLNKSSWGRHGAELRSKGGQVLEIRTRELFLQHLGASFTIGRNSDPTYLSGEEEFSIIQYIYLSLP